MLSFALILVMFFTPAFSFKTKIVDSENNKDELCSVSYTFSVSDLVSSVFPSSTEEFNDLFVLSRSGISSRSVENTVAYLREQNFSSYLVAEYADTVICKACYSIEEKVPNSGYTYLSLAAAASAYDELNAELENFGKFASYFVREMGYLNVEGLEAFAGEYAEFYYGTFYTMFSSYADYDADGGITYDYDAIKSNITESQLSTVEDWFTENASAYLTQKYEFSLDLFADMEVCVGYAENSIVTMDVDDVFSAADASGHVITNYSNYTDSELSAFTITPAADGTYGSVSLSLLGALLGVVVAIFVLIGAICFIIALIKTLMAVIKKSPVNKSKALNCAAAFPAVSVLVAFAFNIMAAAGVLCSEVLCVTSSSAIFTVGTVIGLILFIAVAVVGIVCDKMIKKNYAEFFAE